MKTILKEKKPNLTNSVVRLSFFIFHVDRLLFTFRTSLRVEMFVSTFTVPHFYLWLTGSLICVYVCLVDVTIIVSLLSVCGGQLYITLCCKGHLYTG